jgi:hypothetical protein
VGGRQLAGAKHISELLEEPPPPLLLDTHDNVATSQVREIGDHTEKRISTAKPLVPLGRERKS